MRAIVHLKYGSANLLQLREVPKPQPKDAEVLIRVRAASMHADIWHLVMGRPYILRLMGAGLFSPGGKIPGTDLAGTVEAVGPNATRFKVGDAVFGECIPLHQWQHGGAFAEFCAVPESKLALKPESLSFEQAAAIPTSAYIAYQTVFDEGKLQSGQSLLVNGAAGGVGLFVIQIAKAQGAHVTALDLPGKLEVLKASGADSILDATQHNFTTAPARYDLIIDIPGNHGALACRRALKPGGRYVWIGHDGYGASAGRWLGSVARVPWKMFVDLMSGQRPIPALSGPQERLPYLTRLIEEGKLRPIIDRVFPLEEMPEALRYLEQGRASGKVVISIP